jgi:putative ABC transport system ATP-binding protein
VAGDTAPLFALREVSQARGGREVLHDVTLEIPAGMVGSIIGPSGAGKSSLIRLFNRLDDPARGHVDFRGTPVTEIPIRELRRRVGFVFQSATMFPGTVADNLRVASRYAITAEPAAPDSALAELLASVELDAGFLTRDASSLSGGEQQRVSIARALATRPEVLLLDEPTSALDPEVAQRFMATIGRLCREQQLSILMVTHRLAEAREWSETTVMLDAGHVVESGPTRTLFEDPREERTRLFVRSAA